MIISNSMTIIQDVSMFPTSLQVIKQPATAPLL